MGFSNSDIPTSLATGMRETGAGDDLTIGTITDGEILKRSGTNLISFAESAINHDGLTNFVANKHIDHTSVTLTAGAGLSGGGDISTNRTFDVDINSETEDLTPDGAADYVLSYDASAGGLKKVLMNNLPGGGGGETNTASNINVGGVGVWKQKSGVDLQFRGIIADSTKVAVVLDDPNNEIGIDVNEANLTLNNIGGTLAVNKGGTNITSYTIGDIIYASGATALSKLADVATGNALISGGVGVAPSWGKIGLTTHISGTLPIANGGTGQTTQTAAMDALSPTTTKGDILVDNGTNVIRLAVGTNDQVLTADSAQPSGVKWATGGSGSVTTLGTFDVSYASYPSSNFAQPGLRGSHIVIYFDNVTSESIFFEGVMPDDYSAGNVTVDIYYAATVTTGTVQWDVQWERINAGLDIDSDSFAAAQNTSNTVPGVAGEVAKVSIAFTQAQADSIAAGDAYRLKVTRNTADTAAGDAILLRVGVRQ